MALHAAPLSGVNTACRAMVHLSGGVIHQMSDSFPPCCGRHHFFPKRSFKAALSSMASARSRFSFVFSSSSVFSLGFGYVHPAELGLQLVNARITDPVLAAKLRDRRARLVLFQNADDCSSVKRLRFILWSSQWARAYFKMDYFNGARSQRANSVRAELLTQIITH